jgi:hypothetical protein
VGGKGGEMTQTLYAHMNKIKIKKKEEDLSIVDFFLAVFDFELYVLSF